MDVINIQIKILVTIVTFVICFLFFSQSVYAIVTKEEKDKYYKFTCDDQIVIRIGKMSIIGKEITFEKYQGPEFVIENLDFDEDIFKDVKIIVDWNYHEGGSFARDKYEFRIEYRGCFNDTDKQYDVITLDEDNRDILNSDKNQGELWLKNDINSMWFDYIHNANDRNPKVELIARYFNKAWDGDDDFELIKEKRWSYITICPDLPPPTIKITSNNGTDFGELVTSNFEFFRESVTKTFSYQNRAPATISLFNTEIITRDSAFTANQKDYESMEDFLDTGESEEFEITFTPDETGDFETTIQVICYGTIGNTYYDEITIAGKGIKKEYNSKSFGLDYFFSKFPLIVNFF